MRKIHWAFDPYSDLKENWACSDEVLKLLKEKNSDVSIVPTYFLGHELTYWVAHITPSSLEGLLPHVRTEMEKQLKPFKSLGLEPPEVVQCDGVSARRDLKMAAQYLEEASSDLVVVNTHARKGLKRLFLGSFAENLLLQSKTPVLFISPQIESIEPFDHVFYPTDFSERGFQAFASFLKSSTQIAKEITLYTKVISPLSSFATSSAVALGGAWVSVDHFLDEEGQQRRELSKKWKKLAEEHHLKVHIEIDETPGPFSDFLLKAIENGPYDLVVAPSFSNQMDAILVGSTARLLVRNCQIPVLIRPERSSS